MIGLISARNGWAYLGPTLFIYFFRFGLDLAQNFGLGQIWPGPKEINKKCRAEVGPTVSGRDRPILFYG
jgi:hypothetical protein